MFVLSLSITKINEMECTTAANQQVYDREVILKLNRIKTPTLPTKFGCIDTMKRHLSSSSYENKYTYCGVAP